MGDTPCDITRCTISSGNHSSFATRRSVCVSQLCSTSWWLPSTRSPALQLLNFLREWYVLWRVVDHCNVPHHTTMYYCLVGWSNLCCASPFCWTYWQRGPHSVMVSIFIRISISHMNALRYQSTQLTKSVTFLPFFFFFSSSFFPSLPQTVRLTCSVYPPTSPLIVAGEKSTTGKLKRLTQGLVLHSSLAVG